MHMYNVIKNYCRGVVSEKSHLVVDVPITSCPVLYLSSCQVTTLTNKCIKQNTHKFVNKYMYLLKTRERVNELSLPKTNI